MIQNHYKIITVLIITTILWISNEPNSFAFNERRETLETLWKKAEDNDPQTIGQLIDYYLKRGAFSQALSQMERIASPNAFDPLLLEKVIRAVKGMGKEKETISRLKTLETKNLFNESILLQLYLLTNNRPKASAKIRSMKTLNSSPEFIEFLANSTIDCLSPEEALPFFERFIESELKKEKPNYHPFIKAAKLQVSINTPQEALDTLEAYLDSFTIVEDFTYPSTNKLFTEGYFSICEEVKKIEKQIATSDRVQKASANSKDDAAKSKNDIDSSKDASEESKDDSSKELPQKVHDRPHRELDRLIRQALTTPPESDNVEITQKIQSILDGKENLKALEHLSLAILFRKAEFNQLFLTETTQSLSKKLTSEEIRHLSQTIYPNLRPMQVIATHQSAVYCGLARYQNNNGNLRGAVNSCKHALIENPRNQEASMLIKEWGKTPSIRTMVNQALREINEIHNNIKLLSILAESEYTKSDFPKMYDAAHRVFGCAPHNTDALKAYVSACLHKKLGKRAVEACLTAIGHGANSSAWPILASVAINTGMTLEARIAVKDLVFCQSPLKLDHLTAYLSLCDDKDSRNEFTANCKEQIELTDNTEDLIVLGTMASASALLNSQRKEAISLLRPVIEVISPSDSTFSKAVELSYLLNLDKFFVENLELQAESIIGDGSFPYYWEAAKIARRANFQKNGLVYYGKAIDKSTSIAALEDEFLSFGRTARGFPFFIQGFLEKTTGHYDFYRILGKYYLMKGHKRNSVAFLRLASNHLKHRNDIKFLLGRALCANNQTKEGFQLAEKALEGIDSNQSNISWGIIREALGKGNHRLLNRIIKRWTMSPVPELRKMARNIADYGHLEHEYLAMLQSEEKSAPHALWLPLIRADYAIEESRKSGDFDKTLLIYENALKMAGDSDSVFETNSLALKLAKAYFDGINESKEYERGISTFAPLLSHKNKNVELRKLYERLCVLTYKEGYLLRSIDESMYCFKPLSEKRMKRSKELVNELFMAGILDAFLDQLPPLSELNAEEAASQVHLRWCGSLLKNNDHETSILEEDLVERLKTQGAEGLPVLIALDHRKDALSLIERLLLRHGQVNKPNLMLKKARLLKHSSNIDAVINVYEEMLNTMYGSKWTRIARIELIETLTSHRLFSDKYSYVLNEILSQKNKSLREMVAIGRSFLHSNSLPRLTRILGEIYDTEALLFGNKEREMVTELLEEIANSNLKPRYTILRKSIALVGRKLLNPITNPSDADRLRSISIKMEDDYLKRIFALTKKGTSKSRGIKMFLEARNQDTTSLPPIPDEDRIASLKQLIRLRPPVKDIYGNSLVQRGRIALANILLERGQKDRATCVAKDVIADGHHLGPDEPGSCWLEATRIMLKLMYSEEEFKLVHTESTVSSTCRL